MASWENIQTLAADYIAELGRQLATLSAFLTGLGLLTGAVAVLAGLLIAAVTVSLGS